MLHLGLDAEARDWRHAPRHHRHHRGELFQRSRYLHLLRSAGLLQRHLFAASVTPGGSPVSSTLTITADLPKTTITAALNPLAGRTVGSMPALSATGTALVLSALCFAGVGSRKVRRNLLRCLAMLLTLARLTLRHSVAAHPAP